MEITGTIKLIGDTQSYGTNGFRKREMVITTDEQYPQHILVEFHQDKCDIVNNYQVGNSVKVAINLRGREWVTPQGETKYFNSIQAWRIENLNPQQGTGYQGQGSAVDNYHQMQNTPQQNTYASENREQNDDLPF